ISIGIPSRPSALFTRQTGNVETQSTPSCLRMRAMPVATSIVMDQSSCVREQVFPVTVAFTLGYPRRLLNRYREGRVCPRVDLSAVARLAFGSGFSDAVPARQRDGPIWPPMAPTPNMQMRTLLARGAWRKSLLRALSTVMPRDPRDG